MQKYGVQHNKNAIGIKIDLFAARCIISSVEEFCAHIEARRFEQFFLVMEAFVPLFPAIEARVTEFVSGIVTSFKSFCILAILTKMLILNIYNTNSTH
jgi:hypothetical protein